MRDNERSSSVIREKILHSSRITHHASLHEFSMNAIKVKICGITTIDDALRAVEAGADLLGYNFYPPSPRYISPQTCTRIMSRLESHLLPSEKTGFAVQTVGVFVNALPGEIRTILDDCGLDVAQLSGDEPPEYLQALQERAFKALRLHKLQALEEALRKYPERSQPPGWLVDAYRPGQFGGTGHTADWSLAESLARRASILLAGGLTPDNVQAALQQVNPWGVDVASGVESSPGCKDARKMSAFVSAVRSYVAKGN